MSGADEATIAPAAARSTPEPIAAGGQNASGGLVTAGAMGVMTLCTYGYLIITARILGPATYGGFAAVMNLLAILNVAALALQATAARRVAASPHRRASLSRGITQITLRSSVVLTGVVLAFTPLIHRWLDLDSMWTAALVGASMFPMTLVGGQLGILQGDRQWGRLAAVYLAGGVPRLAVGALLLWWQPSEFTAVLAVTLTLWAPVAVAWWFAHGNERPTGAPHSLRGLVVECLHNVQALTAFLVLSNIDILLARAVLPEHDAGLYAAAMMLARMMLVVSQTVATVVFPDLATTASRLRALVLGIGLIVACGAVATLATRMLPDLALAMAGGEQYRETKDLLWHFVALGTVAALVQFLIYALIAMRFSQAIGLTWVSLVVLVVICSPARTVEGMLAAVTAVNVGLGLVLLGLALFTARSTGQAARPAAAQPAGA